MKFKFKLGTEIFIAIIIVINFIVIFVCTSCFFTLPIVAFLVVSILVVLIIILLFLDRLKNVIQISKSIFPRSFKGTPCPLLICFLILIIINPQILFAFRQISCSFFFFTAICIVRFIWIFDCFLLLLDCLRLVVQRKCL